MTDNIALEVEGPETEEGGGQRYTAHSAIRTITFGVKPADGSGWTVWIEGIPDPAIMHEPWQTPEEAREAAIKAVHDVLTLEDMRQRETERGKPSDEQAEGDEGV